uniref:Uncharacterized protein n=1 Tax=Acrobeloides nanus TaxID=290746 RepID=A0A914DT59_9BILA
MIWVFGLWLAILSLPVPFFYRFLLVCREHLLSNLEFLLAYSISTVFAIGFTILCGFCWYPSVSHPEKFVFVVNNDYWRNDDGSLPSFIAANVMDLVTIVMLLLAGIFVSLVYVLIIYFNGKIWKKLKHLQDEMTSCNQKLQRQFSYTLLIQIIAPLILAFAPVMFVVIFLFLRIPATGFGLIFNMATGWLPVVNATSTILLVGPYRDAILCKKLRRNTIYNTRTRGSYNTGTRGSVNVKNVQSSSTRQASMPGERS